MVQQQNIKTLIELGLTLQEAKVYCSIVEIGSSKVENISKNSKISRSDVYRTVKKLRNMGIIECGLTKPITYRAIDPKIVINTLLDDNRKNFERKKILSLNLLKQLKRKPKNNNKLKKDTIFLSSNQAVIEKVKNNIQKTKKSIDVLTTSARLIQACYNFSDCLQEAWSRKVKGRVLTPKLNEKQFEIFRKVFPESSCEFRLLKSKPQVVVVIYDKKEVSIFTDSSAPINDSTCFWSNNNSILFLAKYYFESNWAGNCDKMNECMTTSNSETKREENF